jgi:hypothetical protein
MLFVMKKWQWLAKTKKADVATSVSFHAYLPDVSLCNPTKTGISLRINCRAFPARFTHNRSRTVAQSHAGAHSHLKGSWSSPVRDDGRYSKNSLWIFVFFRKVTKWVCGLCKKQRKTGKTSPLSTYFHVRVITLAPSKNNRARRL